VGAKGTAMTDTALTKAPGTTIERKGFGEQSIELRKETASTAVAAQAQAEIQAMYIVARANPRSWDDVRVALLKDCGRSGFAQKALYAIERGRKQDDQGNWVPNYVEGLTVRFAEAVIRTAGNLRQSTATLFDDDDQRIIRVKVIDLETNGEYSRDVVVEKSIERKDARDREILGSRQNSYGKEVYLVRCTEDEMAEKEGRVISKTFRTLALRFLPADIIEECNAKIRATRKHDLEHEFKLDPDGARKKVADGFADLGVRPSDLAKYLGADLGQCSPADLELLRGLYAGIKTGEFTWREALAEKLGTTEEGADAATEGGKSIAQRLEERRKKKAAAAAPAVDAKPTDAESKPATEGTAAVEAPTGKETDADKVFTMRHVDTGPSDRLAPHRGS
jgi:hypothetical protein